MSWMNIFKNRGYCKDMRLSNPLNNPYVFAKMFYGCVSLREIIAESPIPPKYYPDRICCLRDADDNDDDRLLYFCVRIKEMFTEKSNCFEGVDRKKCVIRVPKGSVDLYKKAHEWKEFEDIVEI